MKIYYRVIDHCEDSYYEYDASGLYDLDVDYEVEALLEQCADDYWSEHDGWESSWPLTFTLHQEEGGLEVARSVIEMEAEPRFYARDVQADEPPTAY